MKDNDKSKTSTNTLLIVGFAFGVLTVLMVVAMKDC